MWTRSNSLIAVRRAVRATGFALVWVGLFLFGFVGYQLWVTDLLNDRVQDEARETLVSQLDERRDQLAAPVVLADPPTTGPAPTNPVSEPVTLQPEAPLAEGTPLGTIRIPAIGLDDVLFSGVGPDTLTLGPGHMPWTPVPGQPGNAVVSGHRTTHGRPFFDLDLVEPGDVIEVETAVGMHEFTVRETLIVSPTDVWVTDERRGAWLTLTTCNPKFSAKERLVVVAEMTGGPNLDYVRELTDRQLAGFS